MAYIRLPLGIRIAMEYTLSGEPMVNIYHVTTDDPIIAIKLTEIAQIFADWWVSDLAALSVDTMLLTEVTALNLNEENGVKISLPIVPAAPGDSAAAGLPNNVAFVMTMKTAQSGRSFQGRSYLAGMSETSVVGNDVTTAITAFYVTAMVDLNADLAVEDARLVIASFVSEGAPREEGLATPVTSFSANTRVDTQRRRLPSS